MEQLDGSVELILVNDGGRDRSTTTAQPTSKDPRICYLSLARNFGHQIATAGLNFVGGQVIVILDADLQDHQNSSPT